MIQELTGKDLISRDVVENLFAYVVHELMSPLSSLLTGLDLLDVPLEQQEILDLLKTSACTLRGRLELFRTALGAGGLTVDRDSVEKILTLLASDPTHDKIVFETDTPRLAHGVGKQALLIALWITSRKKSIKDVTTIRYVRELFEVVVGSKSLSEAELYSELMTTQGEMDSQKSVALWLARTLSA
jgi:hypothetical protein